MIDQTRRLLLSVKPRFADAILDGAKSVELRRTRPRIDVPTEALIYSSSPVCAVVGHCRVLDVVSYKPRGLWRLYGAAADVTLAEFRAYFDGCDVAFGLIVDRPKRLLAPIGLSAIRRSWQGFQPPQSFRYLSRPRSDEVLALAG